MAKKTNIFVSTLLIVDEFSANVSVRVSSVADILMADYTNYEVVVVDNGLSAEEIDKCKKILSSVPCIRVIQLARNTDIDTAIFAGVEASIGDYICILYNQDPVDLIPDFIKDNLTNDIVFGIATNLKRKNFIENTGAKIFYWYNRKYLGINIPNGSTFYMSLNRNAANALTRSGRYVRHVRHLARRVGFSASHHSYKLPNNATPYAHTPNRKLIGKAIDILANYSSHPLRVVSYFGIFASVVNVIYTAYVVIINLSRHDIEKGWTTLSLQASFMFFFLFIILAMISEYIGKILVESRNEPPYNVMNELSSTISLADETRRNVTK